MPRAARGRRRTLAAMTAGLLAAALLAGCELGAPMPTPTPTDTEPLRADGVLRIGTLLPTSGRDADAGPGQLAAVLAAVRQINAEGGVLGQRVEVVSRSSGDGLESLEDGFEALADREVDVVIGPSDAVLASRAAQLAAEARIPVISPAATGPILLDDAGWVFRTVAPAGAQGALLGRLLPERGQPRVAAVYADGPSGFGLVAPLGAGLAEHGGELVALQRLAAGTDPAAVVAAVLAAEPDAVVLATGGAGELTQGTIAALAAAGLAGDRLWLTSRNAADYSGAFEEGLLAGVNAVSNGSVGDGAFRELVQREDPGARSLRYAAEAFDAAVLAALAALVAGSDAGPAIRAALPAAASDGVPCTSFGECAVVVADGRDPDYQGVSGPLGLDGAGDPVASVYGLYVYGDGNTADWSSDLLG